MRRGAVGLRNEKCKCASCRAVDAKYCVRPCLLLRPTREGRPEGVGAAESRGTAPRSFLWSQAPAEGVWGRSFAVGRANALQALARASALALRTSVCSVCGDVSVDRSDDGPSAATHQSCNRRQAPFVRAQAQLCSKDSKTTLLG
eukprot:362192-Chlamydomonas_euryale.AAC.4